MTIIDKVDLAALRKADSVCFDHNIQRHHDAERASFIRAIKRANPTPADPFATDVTHSISVHSGVDDYGDRRGNTVGFAMLHHADYSDRWRTIVTLLRAGDDVSLRWTAGNNNEYMNGAGLHFDTLDLVVERGKNKLVFRVTESVCADNSARMLRIEGLVIA